GGVFGWLIAFRSRTQTVEKGSQSTQSRQRDCRRPEGKLGTNRLVRHPNGDGNRMSPRKLTNHAVAAVTMHSAQDRKSCLEQGGPAIANGDRFRNICTM